MQDLHQSTAQTRLQIEALPLGAGRADIRRLPKLLSATSPTFGEGSSLRPVSQVRLGGICELTLPGVLLVMSSAQSTDCATHTTNKQHMCAHTNQSVLQLVRPAVRLCCRLGPCCSYHGSSSPDSFVDVCSTKKSLQKLQDNCLHICVRSWCWRLSADNVQSTFRLKQLQLQS